jgi:hypothetical protein
MWCPNRVSTSFAAALWVALRWPAPEAGIAAFAKSSAKGGRPVSFCETAAMDRRPALVGFDVMIQADEKLRPTAPERSAGASKVLCLR